MGKRGQTNLQYLVIAEVVFALIVFAAMLSYVQGVASDSLFEQNFLSRDAALLIDSVLASPGRVIVTYDSNVSANKVLFVKLSSDTKFSFSFDDSRVFVFRDSFGDRYQEPARYPFGSDSNIEFVKPQRLDINSLEKGAAGFTVPDTKEDFIVSNDGKKMTIDFFKADKKGANNTNSTP